MEQKRKEARVNRSLILAFIFLQFSQILFSQNPSNDPHWQLMWSDDFNTFNESVWIKSNYGKHQEEPQLYLKNQVSISNGALKIELNNTSVTCPTPAPLPEVGACGECVNGKLYHYRSGFVETTPQYSVQFGYIEANIKLPYRAGKKWGFWPAFWTYKKDGGSNAAEIDIFEMFAGKDDSPNIVSTCYHLCYPINGPCEQPSDRARDHTPTNFDYRDWHKYAIEWNANRIIWYIDGKAIRTTCNHQIVDPVRIILNLAIQKDSKYQPPTSPAFTEYMQVDYVRVYHLKGTPISLATVVNEISNFNNYDNLVKKSITMSNATTIPSNTPITLRATDFIELKAGFEVQIGKELYLDVIPCSDCVVSAVKDEIPKPDFATF